MEESGGVFAEGEDTEGDEFEFGVCSCKGVLTQSAGKTEEIMAGAPSMFGDLEEDLVDERGSEVGEG